MKRLLIALAAAFTLPLSSPASPQAAAQIDLDQYPAIAGVWSYRPIAGGSEAIFLDGTAAQRFVVRCNRTNRVVSLVRGGVPAAAPTLSLWTTSSARSLPSRFEATRTLTADVAARDSLLDAIAFSRGRFATAAAGAPMLTLRTSPEPARVIEDCRS